MNKLIYFLFGISLLLVGCVNDEDDIFGQPASKRVEQLNEECKQVLVAATNGWVIQYFANTNKFGGYHMWVNFDDEQVIAADESNPARLSKPSTYMMKVDNGAVLSFDGHNEIIHKYSDPQSDGEGFGGDFEFVVVSVTKDQIVFTGKKTSSKIYMNRLPEGQTFSQYLDGLKEMEEYMNLKSSWTLVDGKDTLFVDGVSSRHFVSSIDPEFVENYVYNSAIPTPDGILFSPALTINGNSYVSFKLSDDKKSFLPVKSDLTGTMKPISPIKNFEVQMKNGKVWNLVNSQDAMSAKVRNVYDVLVNSCKAGSKSLSLLGFCIDPVTNQPAVRALLEQKILRTAGNFYFDLTVNENQVNCLYKGENDRNGNSFINNYTGFSELLSLLSSNYEVIPYLNNFQLAKLKLVSKSDPDLWFIVEQTNFK